MAAATPTAERRSIVRIPEGPAPVIRFDGIHYEVTSWVEVGDPADGMVEATMWIPGSHFVARVETIEQTW